MSFTFVAFPKDGSKVYLYEEDRTTKFRQVLWGDFLAVQGEEEDGFRRVTWGRDLEESRTVYIPKEHTCDARPLEIIFVDVGQGDGAVLITPERIENERIIVIDAGIGRNMLEFLEGRFKAYSKGFEFHAAVITHPDEDHYKGFQPIFEQHQIGFDTIYQNGLVERPIGSDFDKVGGEHTDGNTTYVKDLAASRADVERHFSDPSTFGGYSFAPLMHAALSNPNIHDFAMLSTLHGTRENDTCFMPGFAPSDNLEYTIEVLGPMADALPDGTPYLERQSANYNKFKNGHSVLLRLEYKKFRVLFGGDLNSTAERWLMARYAGIDRLPRSGKDLEDAIDKVAARFRCEVMKTCHHGAADVTDAFLQAVAPACFVISSGDDEGHVHPRPDLLGRLGRLGRGESPVLLSTELQRSTRAVEDPEAVQDLKNQVYELAKNTDSSGELKQAVIDGIDRLARSNVEVYGAIHLKTDGERLMTAFKIESDSPIKKWFWFEYKISPKGELIVQD